MQVLFEVSAKQTLVGGKYFKIKCETKYNHKSYFRIFYWGGAFM